LRGGRKLAAFAGPRLGLRRGRAEVFLRARPGLVRFGEGQADLGVTCIAIFPPPGECSLADTRLAFDLGGGVAWMGGEGVRLRLDVGDALTRFNRDSYDFPPRGGRWMHALQLSLGVGMLF
jgi:hypothetical protein